MNQVIFVVPPAVHLLDVAGPAQVFSSANDFGANYQLAFVGEQPSVVSHQGLPLTLTTRWPEHTAADTVLVPGWRIGQGRPIRPPFGRRTIDRLIAHHESGGRVASVCAGALALAEAGLLDGRRATTHHEVQSAMAQRYPLVHVVPDVLFVSDGRVHTSAGIASGIDLALHLVAHDHGPATAARTARSLIVAAARGPNAAQAGAMLRHRDHLSDIVHRVLDVIDERYAEPLPLADLAVEFGVSERTLTRRFVEATGLTPHGYQTQLRIEAAEVLLANGWSREQAAREVGFSDARMLRRLLPTSQLRYTSPAMA